MEQQFLSVDSLLDPQLHNNIQQGRMINNSVGNNNGGMVSDNNNDSGENSVRLMPTWPWDMRDRAVEMAATTG